MVVFHSHTQSILGCGEGEVSQLTQIANNSEETAIYGSTRKQIESGSTARVKMMRHTTRAKCVCSAKSRAPKIELKLFDGNR